MEAEATLTTFKDPPDQSGEPFHLDALQRARDLFTPDYGPLVEGGRGVRALSSSGETLRGALTVRFFSAEEKRVLMGYDGGAGVGKYAIYVLDGLDIAGPVLHDLADAYHLVGRHDRRGDVAERV